MCPQPVAARRPFAVTASRAVEEVARLAPLLPRHGGGGGAAADDASAAALSGAALAQQVVRADADAHAVVVSVLEVLVSVTGALPRPAASTLLVESGGLQLTAWLLGQAAVVGEALAWDTAGGGGALVPVAATGSGGAGGKAPVVGGWKAATVRWLRVAALSSALLGNIVEDCPQLRGDAARALAGAGGFAHLRLQLGRVPELPRLLHKFRSDASPAASSTSSSSPGRPSGSPTGSAAADARSKGGGGGAGRPAGPAPALGLPRV